MNIANSSKYSQSRILSDIFFPEKIKLINDNKIIISSVLIELEWQILENTLKFDDVVKSLRLTVSMEKSKFRRESFLSSYLLFFPVNHRKRVPEVITVNSKSSVRCSLP